MPPFRKVLQKIFHSSNLKKIVCTQSENEFLNEILKCIALTVLYANSCLCFLFLFLRHFKRNNSES